MQFVKFDKNNKASEQEVNSIVDFLYEHLEEFGDPKEDILKSYKYAMEEIKSFGGFVYIAKDKDEIVGATIINNTGMIGYIPENILVYIATHKDHRGKGIGKQLMDKLINDCEGDIALHVESNNPARFLYKKKGFEKKYDEMRYIR